MKYMGSKRGMLGNGLGEILSTEIPRSKRFVDLFCGSGAVSWYASMGWRKEVIACDLQHFAVALASAVVNREDAITTDHSIREWIKRARVRLEGHTTYPEAMAIQNKLGLIKLPSLVDKARLLCEHHDCGPIQSAYGGHYYSPLQSLWIDSLRQSLPRDRDARLVALASLIQIGSECAASPGHTAQPFQVNGKADLFLLNAWTRDPVARLQESFGALSKIAARKVGQTFVADATKFALKLKNGDLVFIDPPYSCAQYSRFYHVLETIALGKLVDVTGRGRYPDVKFRPQSDFSLRTRSRSAMESLLRNIASTGARAILTFPAGEASNGLNGKSIVEIADGYFKVEHRHITGQFSTLGGNRINRDARQHSKELILTLSPK